MKLKMLISSLLVGLTACSTPEVISNPTVSLQANPSTVALGEPFTVTLGIQNVPGTWHVALFAEDPEGNVDQLLPNRRIAGDLTLNSGESVQFPPASSGLELRAAGAVGVTTFLMYASKQPLNLDGISTYANPSAYFATVLQSRQGIGSLEGKTRIALAALNPGVFTIAKLTVMK